MKQYIIIIGLLFSLNNYASNPFRTRILSDDIKSLTVNLRNDNLALPVIELDEDEYIDIRFDEMSHDTHHYGYTVLHCNADWTPSDIQTYEYLDGYTESYITNYNRSINTHYLYTNYFFSLPNRDMELKLSGNYVVLIYEDNQKDKPIAQVCFSVVEPKVNVQGKVHANTDLEIYGKYQQLDFDIALMAYNVRDPMTEIKTVVRQNNRLDNQLFDIKPNYISGSKLSFVNQKDLIFEGGNEYHSFDISSTYAYSKGIDRVEFNENGYEVILFPDAIQRGKYMHDFDVNGRFLINHQEAFEDVHTEADYVWVQFKLATMNPFFDGQLFLGGDLNYNAMNDRVRMGYDSRENAYTQALLLKQGGYNYQYWFVPKGQSKATTTRVDGSYWETENEYTIYVYHRAWGERYDKLIAVSTIRQQ